MRINVYAQEITERVERVVATADNTGATFIGIRFYLDSPDCLVPPNHPDDDSSAVTFWVRSGKSGYKPGDAKPLAELLRKAALLLHEEAK